MKDFDVDSLSLSLSNSTWDLFRHLGLDEQTVKWFASLSFSKRMRVKVNQEPCSNSLTPCLASGDSLNLVLQV